MRLQREQPSRVPALEQFDIILSIAQTTPDLAVGRHADDGTLSDDRERVDVGLKVRQKLILDEVPLLVAQCPVRFPPEITVAPVIQHQDGETAALKLDWNGHSTAWHIRLGDWSGEVVAHLKMPIQLASVFKVGVVLRGNGGPVRILGLQSRTIGCP